MAKGVERRLLMYTYNRFIGHNEVGGLRAFGTSPQEFHQMIDRQQKWRFQYGQMEPLLMIQKRGRCSCQTKRCWRPAGRMSQFRKQKLNTDLKRNNRLMLMMIFDLSNCDRCLSQSGQDEDNFSMRIREYLQGDAWGKDLRSNWTNQMKNMKTGKLLCSIIRRNQ